MTRVTRSYESKKPFQKKVNLVEYSADHDSDEEQETVASVEWIQNNKKLVMCLFGKKYGFDHKKTWVCCKNLWKKYQLQQSTCRSNEMA